MRACVVLLALLVSGCDAWTGKLKSLGGTAHVKCYSGTRLIYDGYSTGKVQNSSQSDGYFFIDQADKKLKEVSGNCLITYTSY